MPAPMICPRQMNMRRGSPRTCIEQQTRHSFIKGALMCGLAMVSGTCVQSRCVMKDRGRTLFSSFLDSRTALACIKQAYIVFRQ